MILSELDIMVLRRYYEPIIENFINAMPMKKNKKNLLEIDELNFEKLLKIIKK